MYAIKMVLRKPSALCTAGIVITYLVFTILQANHFVSTILRGRNYFYYYSLYLVILFLMFYLYARRIESFQKIKESLAFGLLTGYFGGLFASLFMVFFMGDGISRLKNSIGSEWGAVVIFCEPFLYLSWAYGMLAALLVYLLSRLLSAPTRRPKQ